MHQPSFYIEFEFSKTIVYSMVYVQFEYLYKKRNIFIEGQVDQKTLHYVTLLQKVTQRIYLDRIVNFLTQFLNYDNQELGSVLVVLLSILTTETVAHFMFNTGYQDGFGHLVLIGLVLYAFVVHVLFRTHYRIYLLSVLEVCLSIAMAVVDKYLINDYHITGYFLALNTICLLIGIGKKLIESELENRIFAVFQFQSNFLIGIYLISKFMHFYLPYLKGQSLNSFNLIPVLICMASINTIKIWTLFQFNPVYLIGFLISVQKQEKQELEKISLFDEILLMGQKLLLQDPKAQQNKLEIEKENCGTPVDKMDKLTIFQRKTSLPSNILADNDSILESVNEMLSQSSSKQVMDKQAISPYTNLIWVCFGLNSIYAVILITLIVLQKYTDSSLYLMCFGMFKLTLIILYCESQSVMMTQTERHAFYYLLYIISDIWMVGHLVFMYWFYDCFSYENQYCNFSLVIHCFVPLMTRIMYRSLSKETTASQSNQSIAYFFLCWVFTLTIRQSVVIIMSQQTSSYVYIFIDTFLFLYFILMLVMVGKSEFYKWVFEQFQRMRKMRKYKLHVMESLRNWRYNITELNQSFFLINEIILFLGYNMFRKYQLVNAYDYQIEYFIICASGFVVHLLQCYNNYYTQVQLELYEKPKYSQYFNYVILLIGSGIYVTVSFLISVDGHQQAVNSHKKYSLLTAALSIFLTFTNVFSHYSYETVQHFRHASKPINLVISYFIFYYPFITFFTVFFFNYNLETQYIFRFAIAGFAYLTIASVTMGILVHAILNLTEKSKRTLFVIKALSEQFKKINMKQDTEFISMLENLYDMMDGSTDKLLQQLKAQKISKIIFHDDLNVEHDYSIIQPQKKQNDFVKVFADIIERYSDRGNQSKKLILHTAKNIQGKKISAKMHLFKRESFEQNPINKIIGLNVNIKKVENKNHTEIKRLIEAVERVRPEDEAKMKRLIDSSQEYVEILKSQDKIKEVMHRFFHFLSDPEDSLDFKTFSLLNDLLKTKNQENIKYEFNRFSSNGQSISQEGFRDFIVSLLRSQGRKEIQALDQNSASKYWSEFMRSYLFGLMSKGNDIFKYYMKRKNVEMRVQSSKIWQTVNNQDKDREMINFRNKYNMRKNKALGKKGRGSNTNIKIGEKSELGLVKSNAQNIINQGDKLNDPLVEVGNKQAVQQKKHMLFLSPDKIYALLVEKLVETLREYEKIEHENFKLEQIHFGLSNIISILTKLFDFSYLYMYGSIHAMYAYAKEDFSNSKYILSFINYNIVFAVTLAGVVAYVGLIMFHKKQFANGSLGVDENQRAISFTNLKFYTTFLLFLMGSSFANIFIMTSLNSYICQEQSQKLWNFPENICYTTTHIVQMFGSLLILLTYYPLASLIFPFSSAIDRTLQIKYKAEYEIVYLQSKFLVNGINVIFNQMNFQTEQLIKSITKTIVCIILAVLFHKLRPCSVQFINKIELKIYIALAIINGAGILCYFFSLQVTLILSFVVLLVYFVYLLCTSVKISNVETKEPINDSNTLVNDRFKKQQIFKIRLQQCNQNDIIVDSDSNLIKSKNESLYEDVSLNDKAENQSPKSTEVQNFFRQSEVPYDRPLKLKRKNQLHMLTIKMEKKGSSIGSGKLSIKQEPVEMIPATKKKEKEGKNMLMGNKRGEG